MKAEAEATAVAIHTGLRSEECLEAAVVSNLETEARRDRPAPPVSLAQPEDFDLETLDGQPDGEEQEWFSAWQAGTDLAGEADGALSDSLSEDMSAPSEPFVPEAEVGADEAAAALAPPAQGDGLEPSQPQVPTAPALASEPALLQTWPAPPPPLVPRAPGPCRGTPPASP